MNAVGAMGSGWNHRQRGRGDAGGGLRYWLAEHPMVTRFRWDHDAWGSTWVFLLIGIGVYLMVILLLKMAVMRRKRPLPLGPIPAIHNLMVVAASLAILVGCWEATAVEIRETRWIWRKSKSVAEWLVCFPLGTRPSGRVFFWSYVFYLSRYHQLFDTVICILRKKPLSCLHVLHHIMVVCMCFVWLEFSQSLQIVAIMTNALLYVIIYSYFFCRSLGLPCPSALALPDNCYILHFAFTFAAYVALLRLHFTKEGCNGMGAWLFNAFLNATLLLLFINFYLRKHYFPNLSKLNR